MWVLCAQSATFTMWPVCAQFGFQPCVIFLLPACFIYCLQEFRDIENISSRTGTSLTHQITENRKAHVGVRLGETTHVSAGCRCWWEEAKRCAPAAWLAEIWPAAPEAPPPAGAWLAPPVAPGTPCHGTRTTWGEEETRGQWGWKRGGRVRSEGQRRAGIFAATLRHTFRFSTTTTRFISLLLLLGLYKLEIYRLDNFDKVQFWVFLVIFIFPRQFYFFNGETNIFPDLCVPCPLHLQ